MIEFSDLYKKAERISSAIFLVSGIMSESEKLRTEIKDLSIRLVSLTSGLKGKNFSENLKNISLIEAVALNLMSLLEMAMVSNMASRMNVSILKGELENLLDVLNSYSTHSNSLANNSVETLINNRFEADNHRGVRPLSTTNIDHGNSSQGKLAKTTRKDARSKAILDFIKTKESVSIKDISNNVKGCSEKTIQRELLRMVGEGLLKKTGERRWSRYSMVSG